MIGLNELMTVKVLKECLAHTHALWMSAAATVRVILMEGLLCAGGAAGTRDSIPAFRVS